MRLSRLFPLSTLSLLLLAGCDSKPAASLDTVSAMLRARIARERRDARVAKFTEALQARASFRTDEAALQKLQVELQAPQAFSTNPVPGFLPAPPPTR
ncbi:MAG: hypothetical protein JXB05_38175 [Myxococcaceae bacterium]|nr:hypothetical protein [Myxococcaceae bacterium]